MDGQYQTYEMEEEAMYADHSKCGNCGSDRIKTIQERLSPYEHRIIEICTNCGETRS